MTKLTPEALDALLAEHYRRDCMTCDGYCDSCGHTSGRWPDPEWPCTIYLLASEVRDARLVIEAAWKATDYFRDDYEEILRPLNEALAHYEEGTK